MCLTALQHALGAQTKKKKKTKKRTMILLAKERSFPISSTPPAMTSLQERKKELNCQTSRRKLLLHGFLLRRGKNLNFASQATAAEAVRATCSSCSRRRRGSRI